MQEKLQVLRNLVRKLDTGPLSQRLPGIPVNCPIETESTRAEHKRPIGSSAPPHPKGELQ